MARPDLTRGYDGWQAIDATPQETSEGSSLTLTFLKLLVDSLNMKFSCLIQVDHAKSLCLVT